MSWPLVACTAAPRPALPPAPANPAPIEPIPADPCAEHSTLGAHGPWRNDFTGVLKNARCKAEVVVIMKDVADALGVGCTYCHQAADYAQMTHNKLVANWMAREFAPRLRKRDGGGRVGCRDCHAYRGKGVAKILGSPRDTSFAVKWMTAYLTANFDQQSGAPLYCATCHAQTWGRPGFVGRVIPFDRRGNGREERAPSGAPHD